MVVPREYSAALVVEDHKLSVTYCPCWSGTGVFFMGWFIRRHCSQACLKVAEANLIRKKWHDSSRRFRHGLWIADKQNEVLQRCHFLHSPPCPHSPTHMGFWKWHWEEEVALNLVAWVRLWIAGICCCFCGARSGHVYGFCLPLPSIGQYLFGLATSFY